MMKKIAPFFLILTCALLFIGCSKKEKRLRIGIDPEWYSLQLMGKEGNVLAFSNELLREIGKTQGFSFDQITKSWDNLLEGLEEREYEAILSSLRPYLFRENKYQFSELYLATGPVLVLKKGHSGMGNGNLMNKEIGVDTQANEALLAAHYQGATVRYYGTVPQLINAILNEEIDGALINVITAQSFVKQPHEGELEIASFPLNNAGLRFITLSKEKELVGSFNKGLKEAKEKGIYQKLLKKWALD